MSAGLMNITEVKRSLLTNLNNQYRLAFIKSELLKLGALKLSYQFGTRYDVS